MADIESDGNVIGEIPDLFADLEPNVTYEIKFSDMEVYVGQTFLNWDGNVWSVTIHSIKRGHRTFQPDEVLSIAQIG